MSSKQLKDQQKMIQGSMLDTKLEHGTDNCDQVDSLTRGGETLHLMEVDLIESLPSIVRYKGTAKDKDPLGIVF